MHNADLRGGDHLCGVSRENVVVTAKISVIGIGLMAVLAGCGGSSSGPGGVLNVATRAGVIAACANVQTASTDRQAGDDASAVTALQAAVTALRKPPVDPSSSPVAASIDAKLAAGDTAGALAAGTSYCAAHGQ